MKFWIYQKRELNDLQSDFEQIFEVNNLYRDYENVWEWLESSDQDSKFYLNISRSHNWKTGDFEKPIMIIVQSNTDEKPDEAQIAKRIKDRLGCSVFAGEITFDAWDKIVIGEHRNY